MIDEENMPLNEDDSLNNPEDQNLETQEQLNNETLMQNIEFENREMGEDESITDESMGTGDIGTTAEYKREGETTAQQRAEFDSNAAGRPAYKNLRGDNPPGSEDSAFNSDHPGDMNKEQARFIADDIKENFRENIDKASAEINLDKKLKKEE